VWFLRRSCSTPPRDKGKIKLRIMRDTTIIYRSFYEAIKDLDKEKQLEVWNAIFEFSLNFNEVELSGISATVFRLIKPQLVANIGRYKNGKKPKKAKDKQNGSKTEAKDKQEISETEANKNKNNNKNVNKNKKEYSQDILDFVKKYNDYMLLNFPDEMKGVRSGFDISCETIRLLIEVDKFTIEEIKETMGFCVTDDFWKDKVKSLASLRKKSNNDMTKFVNIRTKYLSSIKQN
jgi:hypothetical protein